MAYVPYGLDIVENLGQCVLPELTKRLNAEIEMVDIDTSPFDDLKGTTNVGKMIASLNETTDPKKIQEIATMTDVETKRLAALDKMLAEKDPQAKAMQLRLVAQRVDGLVSRIDSAVSWVSDTGIAIFQNCDNEAETTSKAEIVAAKEFRADERLLSGTGELVWKNLFEAARRFSTGVAYRDKPFPYTEDSAQCLLCQQPLAQEAAKRMRRFDDFVKQDVAKKAGEKRQYREDKVKELKAASLDFRMDAALTQEIGQLDARLLRSVQDFEKKIQARKTWLLATMEAHIWNMSPSLDGDPRPALKLISSNFMDQAAELTRASDTKQKEVLEVERAELRAKANLLPRLKPLLDLRQRMQNKKKLMVCKDDLKTRAISDKAKEFASQAVTSALKDALETEFTELGADKVHIKLTDRVERGKTKHKMVLDLPMSTTMRLDEVLSDGEQRAIAIGSFLAEIHLSGHKGGIVFDDPVSSLDHLLRKRVAQRLVAEAKDRQVIILTHDTTFLGELRDEIDQQKVDHRMCYLEWMNNHPGHVNDGLPWEHQSYKERLDSLEKAQKTLEKKWPTYPNETDRENIRNQYNYLRATIERVIQDVVFNGVVERYRDWIKVNKLGAVAGFDENECNEILRLHTACCDVVNAHDPSSAKNAPVPDAAQLGQDIESLKQVIEAIKTRRKRSSPTSAGP